MKKNEDQTTPKRVTLEKAAFEGCFELAEIIVHTLLQWFAREEL